MLKCLIAFILGWLVSRMMGNGFSVSCESDDDICEDWENLINKFDEIYYLFEGDFNKFINWKKCVKNKQIWVGGPSNPANSKAIEVESKLKIMMENFLLHQAETERNTPHL